MNVTIAGVGYVGLSIAAALGKSHDVTALDVDEKRVETINEKKCPLKEVALAKRIAEPDVRIKATTDPEKAYEKADFVVIAVPTNYDPVTGEFDVSVLDDAIDVAMALCDAPIVVKSTSPIGFTKTANAKRGTSRILFSPEFMREGRSLHDNLYPSRIIVGVDDDDDSAARAFAKMMADVALDDPKVMIMGSTEAEAVKLVSNTYLATRVAFFNEIDSYAEREGLDAKTIIEGVCADPRIGSGYCNPSFGYGGYCLPKDVRQMARETMDVSAPLIKNVDASNEGKIETCAKSILATGAMTVGVHGLAMKAGSDNARASASVRLAETLKRMGARVVLYDPANAANFQNDFEVMDDEQAFFDLCDVVASNRPSESLKAAAEKKGGKFLYTRDAFGGDF